MKNSSEHCTDKEWCVSIKPEHCSDEVLQDSCPKACKTCENDKVWCVTVETDSCSDETIRENCPELCSSYEEVATLSDGKFTYLICVLD